MSKKNSKSKKKGAAPPVNVTYGRNDIDRFLEKYEPLPPIDMVAPSGLTYTIPSWTPEDVKTPSGYDISLEVYGTVPAIKIGGIIRINGVRFRVLSIENDIYHTERLD